MRNGEYSIAAKPDIREVAEHFLVADMPKVKSLYDGSELVVRICELLDDSKDLSGLMLLSFAARGISGNFPLIRLPILQ